MRSGQTANSCKAKPPNRMINVASRDSRSTLRSPVCGDCAFQFIEQLRIDGVDRIDERGYGGPRRGTEQPAHGILCTSPLDVLPSDLCAINERFAAPISLDEA